MLKRTLFTSVAMATLSLAQACDTPIACETNNDCPTDRVCGANNVCAVPQGTPEPTSPEPGTEPGVPEPDGNPEGTPTAEPDANPEPSPSPEPDASACPSPPCFIMPDSPTPLCEDGRGFPGDCPAEGEEAFGQDGNVTAPLTTYSFVNGGIQDDLNDLVWEEGNSETELVPSQAVTRCEEMDAGGRQWRLPTVRELFTLHDFGRDPTINAAFLAPPSGLFQSQSPIGALNQYYAVNLDAAFTVGFYVGVSGNTDGYVKCVSGEQTGGADFVRVGAPTDNIAMDVMTGVMLQVVSNPSADWPTAIAFCNDLTLDGESDWRLATAKDIALGLDPAEVEINRALHPFFDISPRTLWTSTVAGQGEVTFDQVSGQFQRSMSPGTSLGFYCARGPTLE